MMSPTLKAAFTPPAALVASITRAPSAANTRTGSATVAMLWPS